MINNVTKIKDRKSLYYKGIQYLCNECDIITRENEKVKSIDFNYIVV